MTGLLQELRLTLNLNPHTLSLFQGTTTCSLQLRIRAVKGDGLRGVGFRCLVCWCSGLQSQPKNIDLLRPSYLFPGTFPADDACGDGETEGERPEN